MKDLNKIGWTMEQAAQNVAMVIPDGAYVNLGIGLPELVAGLVPADREIIYHTENGLLGMGPIPQPGEEDPELINAGKKIVTAIKGAAFFHHGDSFTMIRGGHIDICVLGAYQISEHGDLANWSIGTPGAIPAVGGAMDLVEGARKVFVITKHTTKSGGAKIVKKATYPLTGKKVVTKIFTNYAVIDVSPDGLIIKSMAPGIDFDFLQSVTDAPLVKH